MRSTATTLTAAVGALLALTGCSPGATSASAPPSTGTTTQASTTAAPGPTCGVDLAARAITDAVPGLRPAFTDPGLADVAWDPTPDGGNYDPCATLSAASVTVVGATGSSPEQVLLFHDGVYQGTGTLRAHGFTTIDVGASTDDTVVVRYGYEKPGESTAEASGRATVRYRWVDGAVRVLDPLPAEVTG